MATVSLDKLSLVNGVQALNPEILKLLKLVFSAESSQICMNTSYELTKRVAETDCYPGLVRYGVLDEAYKAAKDKKSGMKRESAMILLGALFERFPINHPVAKILFLQESLSLFTIVLDNLSDKGGVVRESAQYAIDALFPQLPVELLLVSFLPLLTTYLSKRSGRWQATVGALALIGRIADKAAMGTGTRQEEADKDFLREAMGRRLESLIPIVEGAMHDVKTEVSKQALKTMISLTTLLQNDDVAPRVPLLIATMKDPSVKTLQEAIHSLSQTTFVAIVTSPVLALLTPLLERSLNTPTTPQEVLRQTVVVVENLTKLVHDPVEARTFLPRLKPGVVAVETRASLPEVRLLAARAAKVVDEAMNGRDVGTTTGVITRVSSVEVRQIIEEQIIKAGARLSVQYRNQEQQSVLDVCSKSVQEDCLSREIDRIVPSVAPYLEELVGSDYSAIVSKAIHTHFLAEDQRLYGKPVRDESTEKVIVDAFFSLGYGGMLLLSHTNLRLLKGHRYGLCGRNGAGKSTLMRSISEEKLEGFPTREQLRTCFVEHNQGEDADLSILDFCAKDPELVGTDRARIATVLGDFGFTTGPEGRQNQQVGSLSGGWKMKLALARAILMQADVLLLDEPTNHLDVVNVKWLQDYLTSHTDITSLIVSHDSGFLDAVCTDIYHYEGKKLKNYPGNLSDFVRVKPEARSYYTLSSSNVQFKFPPPGILTGVKSQTRSIIRMTNCSYSYPGASRPQLTNASCSLSLSSRVAIIGPNGAGKSTLIKLLTGETIPQEGRVEKHPNLRIGYIKQHALEHVEMHMEKTPNQYLQWRYANGDDREVMMKQTRVLTPEDRIQMDKMINLGDGKGEKRIEALIGRQKYKKSFQYEVKWIGKLPKENNMISRETLLELGFSKLVQEFDDHEASREGLGFRELSPKVISKHFEDVGMDPEIADHNEISGLSGGQKVKVVLAGAMWNNPHLLVLDEPTNFLDRDSLGGLAVAIREFKGGVVMISHNGEFVGALCPEQWHVSDGKITHKQGGISLAAERFEDSGLSSAGGSGAGSSVVSSANASTVNSDGEEGGELKFKAKKKKKMTRNQVKEREIRRRQRYIDWLNSPKGTPKYPDTDDDEA